MQRVGYTTTGNQPAVRADSQNIAAAHHVTRGGEAALSASVHALALVPLSAYGARLRRIGFVLLKRAAGLVVQLVDDLGVAGS
jgi:hypothetical protein